MPAVRQLVREQPAFAAILVPFGEIVGLAAVLAAAMMFEPDPAKLVAEREQKFIAVEMADAERSEEHTSELQSLMRISYAVFCLKQQKQYKKQITQRKIKT